MKKIVIWPVYSGREHAINLYRFLKLEKEFHILSDGSDAEMNSCIFLQLVIGTAFPRLMVQEYFLCMWISQ